MFKVKSAKIEENFMRLNVEDGVAGSLIIQRTSGKIDPNKAEQLIINYESEALELIELIKSGIPFLNGKIE